MYTYTFRKIDTYDWFWGPRSHLFIFSQKLAAAHLHFMNHQRPRV